jgi:tetratricopeptide (TPR) repeat protein
MRFRKTINGAGKTMGLPVRSIFLGLIVLQFFCTLPLSAQRVRRATTTAPSPKAGTKAAQPATDVAQIEQRNQALLQQIMSLQKERDFYKKKITEWTQEQAVAARKQEVEEEKSEEPKKPEVIGNVVGYFLPITPELLDSMLSYRKAASREKPPMVEIGFTDTLDHNLERLRTTGHYQQAVELFEKLIRTQGVKDIHFLSYGKFLYLIGDYPRALEILSGVTGGNRELALASYYKGRIYQCNGAGTMAQVEFYRSEHLQPDFVGAEVGNAFKLLEKGQLDSARSQFLDVLNYYSGLEGEIYLGLAQIAARQLDQSKAIEYYQKSLVHEPELTQSCVELGIELYNAEDCQSSILFLQQVLDVWHEPNTLYLFIGKSYYFMKKWDRALASFQKIGDASEVSGVKSTWQAKLYYIKSLLAREQGDHQLALDYFRKAKEINPDAYQWMVESLEDLGKIYEKESDYNDALSYYSKMVRLDPTNVETVLKVGKFYYYIGESEEARKYFTYALENEQTAEQADWYLKQIDLVR